MVGVGHPFMSVELHGISPSLQVVGQVAGHSLLSVPIILGTQVSGPLQPFASG